MPEFTPWPKIARLNRDIVITEKIDGTNAAIGIVPCEDNVLCKGLSDDCRPLVYAQSRTRIITPQSDNFGFASWVQDHAPLLAELLGPGLHFGEWWGSGIQRGYGLDEKRFSLFNTAKWRESAENNPDWWGLLDTVPVLYEGPFMQRKIDAALIKLGSGGSVAAPGFMKPEGIVVFHAAAGVMFKVTIEGDEKPKGVNG